MRSMDSVVAFEHFVAATSGRLHRACFFLCRNPEDADDMLQTAYERVYRRWQSLRSDGDPEAYARQVIANLAIDAARKTSRLPKVVPLSDDDLPTGSRVSRDDWDAPLLARMALVPAIQALPPRQRTAIVLRTLLDLSEAQTATAMRCSIGTVKSTTSRALSNLRRPEFALYDLKERCDG
jgi:RNA polymerase sigma-70 factor (sigma-E family)